MLELAAIRSARERITPFVHRTPVLTSQSLNRLFNKELYFKGEHLQKTGSFKARGALNAALQLKAPRGLLGVSSGNHAQGVAYAARVLGVPALIVMPEDASPLKKEVTRSYGAEIYDRGVRGDNREAIARALAEETGYTLIHPFDDEEVMAGQGTLALEFLEDVPELEAVLVAVGGGGLISGVSTAVKALSPNTQVLGVEPALADDARRSLEAGRLYRLEQTPPTIADGVRTLSLGERPWQVIRQRVDRILIAQEASILEAQRLLLGRLKQVVEPTGALALAPLLEKSSLPRRLGIILCGGNWLP
jgi:threonine dehydratase